MRTEHTVFISLIFRPQVIPLLVLDCEQDASVQINVQLSVCIPSVGSVCKWILAIGNIVRTSLVIALKPTTRIVWA